MSKVAILSFDQYQKFRGSGRIPQFYVDDQQIPAFSFEGMKRKFGTTREFKLFPKDIGKDDLKYLYDRCDIATNAVDIVPDDVWGKGFTVKVTNKEGEELKDSQLEKDIWQINQDHKIRKVFNSVHKKARLYGLGIIVFGLGDGKQLNEPVDGGVQKLSYLRVFGSNEITDIRYDTVEESETYGQILTYEITRSGKKQQKFVVHSSRVIHVNNGEPPIGTSVLLPCYDLFQILKNTDWSAGESYYQNASPIFIVTWEEIEDVEPPTKEEIDAIKEDIKDLHVKKRFVLPKTWHVEVVRGSGQLPDPGKIWNPIIERVAGGVKVPKQLLLGTSAGALASGEVNLQQYYKNIGDVQSTFAEPLLVEFYNRLKEWGILPEGNFDIEWAPLWEMDEKDRAEIDNTKMKTAVSALGDPARGIPAVMDVQEVREQILGLNPKIGGGRLPTMKTEASKQIDHQAMLTFSVELLQSAFKGLVNRAKDGLDKASVLTSAELLISEHVKLARENARQNLERKLARSIPNLSAEQEEEFQRLEAQYLSDFTRILEDALKHEAD